MLMQCDQETGLMAICYALLLPILRSTEGHSYFSVGAKTTLPFCFSQGLADNVKRWDPL